MIGQQEVEDETVTIKDMDSGCQETIPQNTVVSELLK
jgi:histidyl-tRNA synthetase